MKPCYYYGDELLVLIELMKDGENLWQSCKARISQGTPPSNTMISKKVAARAGWWTLPDGEAMHQEAPVVLHCKLRVGRCELSTDVHIVDEEASSEQRVPFKWYIHLGESVVKALICANWEADICYLDGLCKKGSTSPMAEDAMCCTSFTDALGRGHVDCMRYWHGRPIFSVADGICEVDNAHLRLLKQEVQTYEQNSSCEKAARQPSAEALMYVHDVLGMSWDKLTCDGAAWAGSISCLSYAHCSGCPWNADVCRSAAEAGKLACLAYAHEHGCAWDRETCEAAAGCGHLDCLVYAFTNGCHWDERTCRSAAGSGHLEILAYAHENGFEWDASTCAAAARAGNMECLVYAHKHGCPWDDTVCEDAAQGGNVQCLRYAHEHGCHWTEDTLMAAARAGNLECLMYAHEHGCPYDRAAIRKSLPGNTHGLTFSAIKGVVSLPCLKYVHESMGCMWDPKGSEWMHAIWEGRCDVLKYIHNNGGACWGDNKDFELESLFKYGRSDELLDGKARCLVYMHRYGGCKLPPLEGTKVGKWMAIMRERTKAVLLCFRAAGRVRASSRSPDAVHAAMAMVPADHVKQIMYNAKLLFAD